MKSKLKENKGITLITLVITIVVLAILAGITLSATKGEKGVISNAKQAKNDAERKSLQEQIELVLIKVEKKYRNPTMDNVREGLKKEGIIDNYSQVDDETGTVTSNNGTIFERIAEKYIPTIGEKHYGDASAVPTDQKYFTFELDNTNMTATITGIKDSYSLEKKLYYYASDYSTVLQFVSGINDGTKDIVIPFEYKDGAKTYIVDSIGYAAFGFDSSSVAHGPYWAMGIGYWDNEENYFQSFKLPNTIKTIGENAFAGQMFTKEINIPEGIVSIGAQAFAGCSKLKSMNMPTTLTTIGMGAFSYCTGITNINIPSTVTNIGTIAFKNWTNSQTINCQASSKPSGWNSNWNLDCNATINWGQSM